MHPRQLLMVFSHLLQRRQLKGSIVAAVVCIDRWRIVHQRVVISGLMSDIGSVHRFCSVLYTFLRVLILHGSYQVMRI